MAGAGRELHYRLHVQRDCAGLLERIHFLSNGRETNPLAWLADNVFIHMPTRGWAAFTFSVFTLAYCFIPVAIMYKKKIFVKV